MKPEEFEGLGNVITTPVDQIGHAHIRDLSRAYEVAKRSQDRSTRNGAVIMQGSMLVSEGWNGLPTGVLSTYERLTQRPTKYSFCRHAETHAIYMAARDGKSTLGATMYCPWFACDRCAIAIIESGITRVFGHLQAFGLNPRWDLRDAFTMMSEAGVEIILMNGDLGVDFFCDGKEHRL